jgi:hypothetical protein
LRPQTDSIILELFDVYLLPLPSTKKGLRRNQVTPFQLPGDYPKEIEIPLRITFTPRASDSPIKNILGCINTVNSLKLPLLLDHYLAEAPATKWDI